MNVSILSLLLAIALVVPAAAQTNAAAQPSEAPAPQVATKAGTDQPAAAEPAPAPAPAAQSVVTPAMIQEFRELRDEIVKARKAVRKSDEIAALQALREAAIQAKDVAAIHQHSIDIHKKTEELLAAQPGMAEKLARFQELGETMSRDLPAEKRRKGKRLPKRPDEPTPAETTPAEATPAR